VAGLLICLSFDLTFYGVGKFYVAAPLKGIATDVIISAIVSAIGGAGAAWVYGMKRAVAAA
jgi:TM2 domain-containing membrane protein YozV